MKDYNAFKRWLEAGMPTKTYADRERMRHVVHLRALHGADSNDATRPSLNSAKENINWILQALENDVARGVAPPVSGLNVDLNVRFHDEEDPDREPAT